MNQSNYHSKIGGVYNEPV